MELSNAVIETEGDIEEDVIRCLRCLYSTVEGTCPIDRDFGLSIECIDKPFPVAKNLYTLDVIEKTEQYEPRVEVTGVSFEMDGDILKPHIKIAINEDYSEDEDGDEEW